MQNLTNNSSLHVLMCCFGRAETKLDHFATGVGEFDGWLVRERHMREETRDALAAQTGRRRASRR